MVAGHCYRPVQFRIILSSVWSVVEYPVAWGADTNEMKLMGKVILLTRPARTD